MIALEGMGRTMISSGILNTKQRQQRWPNGSSKVDEKEEELQRSLEAIALLSFGSLDSIDSRNSLLEKYVEKPAAESSSAPWNVFLKPTGKGQDIRQGVSLAAPITFFRKDDKRLYHEEASNMKLKHAEPQQALTSKGKTDFVVPKLKSPGPVLPKNVSRSPPPQAKTRSTKKTTAKAPHAASTTTAADEAAAPNSAKAAVQEEKKADASTSSSSNTGPPRSQCPDAKTRGAKETFLVSCHSAVPPVSEPLIGGTTAPHGTTAVVVEKQDGPRRIFSPEKEKVVVKEPASSQESHNKLLSDLENKVQSLEEKLRQSEQKFQELTLENSKITNQLHEKEVDKRQPPESSAAAAGAPPPLPKTEPQQPPCGSCMKLRLNIETLMREKVDLETNQGTLQQSLQLAQQETENIMSQMKEENERTEAVLQEWDEKLGAVVRENETWTMRLEKAKTEQETANQELQEVQSHLRRRLSNAQALLEKVTEENQKDKEIISQLQERVDAVKQENQNLHESLMASQNENKLLQSQVAKETAAALSLKKELEEVSADRRDARESVKAAQSEMASAKKGLEESQERNQTIQNERDDALVRLKETESQMQEKVKLAREASKILLQQSHAKVAELLETLDGHEAEKSSLQADLLKKIQAKDEIVEELKKQNESMEAEKKKVQSEMAATKKGLQKCQEKIQTIQNERDDALFRLEEAESLMQEKVQLATEASKVLLQESNAKVAELLAILKGYEEEKSSSRADLLKKIQAKDEIVEELKKQNESMEAEKKQGKLQLEEQIKECQALRKRIENAKLEMGSAKASVYKLQEEVNAVRRVSEGTKKALSRCKKQRNEALGALYGAQAKCRAAIIGTEEMKALLEKDEEMIAKLHATVIKLEGERETLSWKPPCVVSTEQPEAPVEKHQQVSWAMENDESEIDFEDFEIDPDELMQGMNMPESLDDSMAYLGGGWDLKQHRQSRHSSISALEDLESDLRNLLYSSEEILPGFNSGGSTHSRAMSVVGGRKMKPRDYTSEQILSEIRNC